MFKIKVGEKFYKLPVNTIDTEQIYNYLKSVLCLDEQRLVISYKKIILSRERTYNLLEIGYSPNEILEIIPYTKEEAIFNITEFNYKYILLIDEYTTVFTIKEYFSEQFYTVPSNIVIKIQDKLLSDDQLLLEIKKQQNVRFDITVKQSCFLVRTYYHGFKFVCVSNNSTVGNLKDTISMYTLKDKSIITYFKYSDKMKFLCKQNGLPDEKSIDECPIQKLKGKIQLFEFTSKQSPVTTTCKVEVNIVDNNMHLKLNTEYNCSIKTSLYAFKCLIEKEFRIDRDLFESDKNINVDPVQPDRNSILYFYITKPFVVKIQNKVHHLSYLMSIKYFQDYCKFDRHNFGAVINNHFAFHDEQSKYLLVHFMNNSDNDGSVTEINFYMSQPCHLRTYIKCDSKGKKENKKNFIIPDDMTKKEVFKTFLHLNSHSFKTISNEHFIMHYKDSDKRKINYLIDAIEYYPFFNFKKKDCVIDEKITLEGKNLRVLDLILNLYLRYHEDNFEFNNVSTYEAAEAIFNDKKLPFYEPLSNIFDDKKNRIFIKGHHQENDITIYNFEDCKIKKIRFNTHEANYPANDIINKFSRTNNYENLRLYADFNELKPNEFPFILKLDYNFLILNKICEKKHFLITNGTSLICSLEVSRPYFHSLASLIAGMFSLQEDEVKFIVKDNIKCELPSKFDAGCFMDDTLIEINYNYVKKRKMTFRYVSSKALKLPDVDQPIELYIPMIEKELNMENVSKTAIQFLYHDFEIKFSSSLSSLKIPGNSTITIRLKQSNINIKLIELENPTQEVDYFFNEGDTIKDIADHFKTRFESNVYFSLEKDGDEILSENRKIEKDMKLYYFSKKIRIISEGSLEEKTFEVSDILTVADAIYHFQNVLNQKNIFIFTKNEQDNSYEAVDINKRLFEYKCQLYLHMYVPRIEFINYEIFTKREYMSEMNTIEWLKNRYISRIILMEPEKFTIKKIVKNKKKNIDNNLTIGDLNKLDKVCIDFVGDKTKDQTKQKKVSKKKFKPSITPLKGSNSDLSPFQSPKKASDDDDDIEEGNANSKPNTANDESDSESDSSDSEEASNINADTGNHDALGEEDDVQDLFDSKGNQLFSYNFQIDKNVEKISFKLDATIEDAKIKIAKLNGDIDPNCVLILFAGKVLRKDMLINNLKLDNRSVLQVLIRSTEDVFLRTAKALRCYGQADIEEYYSEYEDEE